MCRVFCTGCFVLGVLDTYSAAVLWISGAASKNECVHVSTECIWNAIRFKSNMNKWPHPIFWHRVDGYFSRFFIYGCSKCAKMKHIWIWNQIFSSSTKHLECKINLRLSLHNILQNFFYSVIHKTQFLSLLSQIFRQVISDAQGCRGGGGEGAGRPGWHHLKGW